MPSFLDSAVGPRENSQADGFGRERFIMARLAAIVPTRLLRIALACAVLIGAAIAATIPAGAAPAPAPTGISAAASTDNSTLGGAVPAVLVAAGSPFALTVTLTPAGATFNTDTKLSLTASLASGAHPGGSLSPASIVMPGGVSSAQFSISYSAVENGVQVTVSVAKATGKISLVTPSTTASFDVLKTVEIFPSTDPALGSGLGVGDADCSQDTTESECGVLVLPNGFSSQNGALSLGACTSDLGCTAGSQVVQFIADLGSAYSPADPATLIIRCSKQLCAGKGVSSYTLKVSFSATGPLNLVSAPCTSKGVALDAAGNTFCTDYVQSHRDNAGDVLLYLLFVHDARGST
jgi:hypothetical protein